MKNHVKTELVVSQPATMKSNVVSRRKNPSSVPRLKAIFLLCPICSYFWSLSQRTIEAVEARRHQGMAWLTAGPNSQGGAQPSSKRGMRPYVLQTPESRAQSGRPLGAACGQPRGGVRRPAQSGAALGQPPALSLEAWSLKGVDESRRVTDKWSHELRGSVAFGSDLDG